MAHHMAQASHGSVTLAPMPATPTTPRQLRPHHLPTLATTTTASIPSRRRHKVLAMDRLHPPGIVHHTVSSSSSRKLRPRTVLRLRHHMALRHQHHTAPKHLHHTGPKRQHHTAHRHRHMAKPHQQHRISATHFPSSRHSHSKTVAVVTTARTTRHGRVEDSREQEQEPPQLGIRMDSTTTHSMARTMASNSSNSNSSSSILAMGHRTQKTQLPRPLLWRRRRPELQRPPIPTRRAKRSRPCTARAAASSGQTIRCWSGTRATCGCLWATWRVR